MWLRWIRLPRRWLIPRLMSCVVREKALVCLSSIYTLLHRYRDRDNKCGKFTSLSGIYIYKSLDRDIRVSVAFVTFRGYSPYIGISRDSAISKKRSLTYNNIHCSTYCIRISPSYFHSKLCAPIRKDYYFGASLLLMILSLFWSFHPLVRLSVSYSRAHLVGCSLWVVGGLCFHSTNNWCGFDGYHYRTCPLF